MNDITARQNTVLREAIKDIASRAHSALAKAEPSPEYDNHLIALGEALVAVFPVAGSYEELGHALCRELQNRGLCVNEISRPLPRDGIAAMLGRSA